MNDTHERTYNLDTVPWLSNDGEGNEIVQEIFRDRTDLARAILEVLASPRSGVQDAAEWKSKVQQEVQALIMQDSEFRRATIEDTPLTAPGTFVFPSSAKEIGAVFDQETRAGRLKLNSATTYSNAVASWFEWCQRRGVTGGTSVDAATLFDEWLASRPLAPKSVEIYRRAFEIFRSVRELG